MSIPRYHINSMTYSSSVLTINSNFQDLKGGGSFSAIGFSQPLYFSHTSSFCNNDNATYSITLSPSTTYSLTFSFFKAPYYNLDVYGITSSTLSYDTNYIVNNYIFRT